MASYTAVYRDIDVKATITLRTGTQFTVTSTDIYGYTADSTAAASGIPLGEAVSGSFSLSVTASACPYSAEQLDGAEVRMSMGVRNDTTSSYTYTDAGAWYVTNVSSPEGSSAVTLKGSDALGVFFDGLYTDEASTYPMTMGGMLALVCAIAGVTLKTTTFFNSDVVISTRPSWGDETSLRSIVGYIAACAAGFAQIDQSGKLEIITDGQGTKVNLDGDIYNQFTPEGGSRFAFNCIRVTLPPASEDDTEGETVRVAIDSNIADDASNCVVVDNNPLMTEALAATVRDKLNGVEFEGYSVDWLGDPAVMCGHIMELTALDGVKHTGLVTSRKLTFDGGLSMTLTSAMPAMHSTSSHYTSAGRLFNSDGTLPVYRVSGVSGAVVNAMLGKFDRVIAGDITTDTFFARMAKIVELSVQNFEADTIDAKIIKTGSLDATKITAGSITADRIKTGAITAGSGIISNGAIGTAQIADGSITEAKVVSLNADVIKTGTLSAERLLLVGDDGVIYRINAASSGLSLTELSQDQYKNYINGTVIVAKSITAAQIAAKTITGNEILANSITSGEIDVADLFAAQATIDELNAMDITGNSYLRLYVDGTQGANLLKLSKELTAGSDADSWRYTNATSYSHTSGFTRMQLSQSGLTEDWQCFVSSPLTQLSSGWTTRKVTLSAWIWSADWSAVDQGITWTLCLSQGGTTRLNYGAKYNIVKYGKAELGSDATSNTTLANSKWVRVSTTFDLTEDMTSGDGVLTDNTHIFAQFYLRRNGDVRIYAPKLEFGTRGSDWSAAPEDDEAEIAEVRSELTLTKDQINASVSQLSTRVTTAETSLQLKADQATLTSTASGLQSQIDAIPGQISLEVSQVQVGGTQLLRDTKALTVGTDADSWRYSTYASMYTDPSGFNRIKLNSTGATANTWTNAMSPITRLKSGWLNREVTLSAWMYSPDWAAIDGSLLFGVYLTKGDTTRLNYWEKNAVVVGQVQLSANATSNVPLANNTWARISVKLKLSTEDMKGDGVLTDNTHMYAGWYLAKNGDVRIYAPKLEFGNKATDWSAYPEEFNAGSSIRMNTEEVRITTPEFIVDVVDEDGETSMLSIDENGAQMQSLVCPDVAPRYNGPATLYVNKSATSAQIAAGNYYRSITDAAAALSNKWIGKDVVAYVAAGTVEYGTVTLQGANGSGSIYIIGDSSSPAKLVGKLQIIHSGCPVLVRYLNVDSTSGGVGVDCSGPATMAIIENCVITGKGVSVSGGRGVRTFRGAHADVHSCELYDHERSLYAQQTGTIRAYANKGNCRVAADGGTIYASGAMPCDTTSFAYGSYAGQIITASDISVSQGSKPTAEAIPTTVNVTASATDSWYSASSAWLNQDNVIRQGYYSGMGEWSGCFWFPTTSFSGKTIKTASLTLTRTSGSGKSGEVTLTLYGITIASASGNPNSGGVSYGALGTIANGETKTFTLPTTAAQALASGTIKGFMLCAGDGAVMSGRKYSTNYCKIGSSGDVLPKLSVSY